jgi:hypothetical protein
MRRALNPLPAPGSLLSGLCQLRRRSRCGALAQRTRGSLRWSGGLRVVPTPLRTCGQAGAAPAQAPEHLCRGRERVLLAPLEGDPSLASLGLREVHALRQAPPRQCPRGRQRPPHRPTVKAIPTVLMEKNSPGVAAALPRTLFSRRMPPLWVPPRRPPASPRRRHPRRWQVDSRACLCGALNGSHFELGQSGDTA